MTSSSQETLIPPAPSHKDAYSHLILALHPTPPSVLEIDILPSTHPSHIHHSHPALAFPKPLLIQLYLIARKDLFVHISSPDPETYDAALLATAIVLLWDPNHLTAANFRKQHIQSLLSPGGIEDDGSIREASMESLKVAIERELRFLDSLVTSPLKKHSKSPTLWHQRLWLHQNYFPHAIGNGITLEDTAVTATRSHVRDHWEDELAIVMKAGERHPRNYYAWQYARQLFALLQADLDVTTRREQEVLVETLGRVKEWCFLHPRDVSGWSFLVWLMERARGGGSWKAKHEARRVVWEVGEWVNKYQWVGASVEWVLEATKELSFGERSQ